MEKKISNHNIYIYIYIYIYILLLMILTNFQVLYLMKGLKQTKLATIIDLNNVKQRAIKNEKKQKNYKHLI